MDKLSGQQRHKNMVANKSRGTRPELLFGKLLWNAGVRYRKNDQGVKGTPDFSVRKYRAAIFCDGEFWHGRDWETRKKDIKSNRDYWYPKIDRNIKRDKEINSELEKGGWKVFRFWESELKNDAERCLNEVLEYISCCRNSG
jgi:DNA mismatch endonuclease Vsr